MPPSLALISFLLLMGLGYAIGSARERRHYHAIHRREQELLHKPTLTAPVHQADRAVAEARLATNDQIALGLC